MLRELQNGKVFSVVAMAPLISDMLRMSRPKGLTLTAVLMVFCGVMALATITPGRPHSGRLLGILTLWLCIALFIIWVYWNGRSWARSAVLAFSGACILNLYAWNRVPFNPFSPHHTDSNIDGSESYSWCSSFVLFEHASGPRFLLSGEQTSSIGEDPNIRPPAPA